MATARSASAEGAVPVMSLVDTTACLRPTKTRKPRSSLSERSDGDRHRTHRDRVGGIRAGLARSAHKAFGEGREGGLIEKGCHAEHFSGRNGSGSPQKNAIKPEGVSRFRRAPAF